MSTSIPTKFIDELLARTDIVDIISPHISLKKKGQNYQACCPFHQEKTPSFSVSPAKQFYYCFGCHASGNAITFLREYEHLDFVEAVSQLAQQAGMSVPQVARSDAHYQQTQPLLDLLEKAAQFYHQSIMEHPDGKVVADYMKSRGISHSTYKTFQLGVSPKGWQNLEFLNTDTNARKHLIEAGLCIEKDSKRHYDRFRGRFMFPIRNRRGKVIGFGGRAIGDDQPKYLNSPETPVFHKGQELFGLFEAQKSKRKIDNWIIVEGYMDVVMLHQYGLTNAVATLGTATSPDHLKQLFRLADELFFCFDGDRAGQDAAWRALNVALPLLEDGRQIKFIFLPEDSDPDSFVREHGEEAFQKLQAHAISLPDYLLKKLAKETDLETPDGKARLVKMAKPAIESLPQGVLRELIKSKLASMVGLPAERLAISQPESRKPKTTQPPPQPPASLHTLALRTALSLVLQQPKLANSAPKNALSQAECLPGVTLLKEIIQLAQETPNTSTAMLLAKLQEKKEIERLTQLSVQDIAIPTEGFKSEFLDALNRLEELAKKHEIQSLLKQSSLGTLSAEQKQRLHHLLYPTNQKDDKNH